jgi:hypothetical protein
MTAVIIVGIVVPGVEGVVGTEGNWSASVFEILALDRDC